MPFTPKANWADLPATTSPITKAELDRIEAAIAAGVATADAAIPKFADPNADRILFWDDSAGVFTSLSVTTPLTITGTALSVAAATESAAGIQEFATAAETVSGASGSLSVHPAGLLATRGLYVAINAQTGTTYAPVLTDQGKWVSLSNTGAITVTMPSDATIPFPIGTIINFSILNTGMATFIAGASAVLNVPAGRTAVSFGQYSTVSLQKRAANTWLISGDLA